MKKFFVLSLALLSILAGFTSCGSDDDNAIKFYVSTGTSKLERVKEITVGTILSNNEGAVYAFIRGGDGIYNAQSSNQQVVNSSTIRIEELHPEFGGDFALKFKPEAEGETTITVTDSEGNMSALKVTVEMTTQKFNVSGEAVKIEGADEATEALIVADMKANNLENQNSFIFEYKEMSTGTVKIYSDLYAENLKAEGTFRIEHRVENDKNLLFYIMNYDSREHVYELTPPASEFSQKSSEFRIRLVEDLTEEYQQQYPALTEAKYSFVISHIR